MKERMEMQCIPAIHVTQGFDVANLHIHELMSQFNFHEFVAIVFLRLFENELKSKLEFFGMCCKLVCMHLMWAKNQN